MIKKILIGFGGVAVLLAVLLIVLVARALLNSSQQLPPGDFTPLPVDEAGAVERLSEAVTYRTISHQIPWEFRGTEFERFHVFLEESYPLAHASMTREVVSRYSLLYTWEGSDPALKPVIFLAHLDVVPVDAGSAEEWTHPPFDGVVDDGHIWGRGTLDNKSSVLGLLETAETLLEQGFTPRRTIYFAFGHDEEIGGPDGAGRMAALLEERGVEAWFTLDEGSGIVDGILPGIDGPIALVSVSEKGYVTLELKVRGEGGHSSNPPPSTSIGILAAAITRIEANPFEPRLSGPFLDMLEVAGPEMAFPLRVVMSNLWLFKPLLQWQLSQSPVTNAALRTTTAVTMMDAGTKENVLPIEARAMVNYRILAGDTSDLVLERTRSIVNDERVEISVLGEHEIHEPSPVSDKDSDSFRLIAQSVRDVMPDVPVAPGMTLAGTDTKHYYNVAENLYRLQPMVFTSEDLATIHGTDERIAIDNYLNGIQIFGQIIRAAAGP